MNLSVFNSLIILLFASLFPALGATHYVDVNSAAPAPPYNSWAGAARTIQEAVDIASSGDLILVTNGVYAIGRQASSGALSNRVAVTKPLTVRSVNGPLFTIIQGYQVPGTTNGDNAIRCVSLADGASLSGFTLTNGATRALLNYPDHFGGAVFCESTNAFVSDCLLTGNSSFFGGGGSYQGTFTNCTFTSNRASYGGGCYESLLSNCLLTNNTATSVGGATCYGALANCLILANTSAGSGGGVFGSRLYKCTLGNNAAANSGGGASSGTISNCTITNNTASDGGGIYSGILFNCLLTSNWATNNGGGAYSGTLYNCTLTGNSAAQGGGGYGFDSFHIHANCTLYNSIIYSNLAALSTNCACTQYDSCLPSGEGFQVSGNVNAPPQFINPATGDFRLQPTSPCINAGNNSVLASYLFTNSFDLDGNPRVAGGTVDIGAYELPSPPTVISIPSFQHSGIRSLEFT